jgi:hypothetical protein
MMTEDIQGNLARVPSDLPSLPRPWSKALEEALKKDYPHHTFRQAMETLFLEYERNYLSQGPKTQPVLPEIPQTSSQRQTASVSPGVSTNPG